MRSEQPEVRIDQVWQDCDKRMGERYLRVVRVMEDRSTAKTIFTAVVRRCTENGDILGGGETRIAVRRMKPGATGYRMVRDAK